MISNIKTIALNGIQGELIEVQTSVSTGLPEFSIVGLPDTSVKEAKERRSEEHTSELQSRE